MDATVLYHKNCNDGLASALVMKVLFDEMNQSAEYIPVQYGDNPPDNFKGKHLYIVDFCYSPETLVELSKRCASITVFDHHQKAFDMFENYKGEGEWTNKKDNDVSVFSYKAPTCDKCLSVILTNKRSGAGLALDNAYEMLRHRDRDSYLKAVTTIFYKRLESIVDAVEDRDLWKFQLKETPTYYHMLRALPQTVDHWFDLLIESEYKFQARLAHAEKQNQSYNWCVRQIALGAARAAAFGDFVYVLECHTDYTSAVADLLAPLSPFVVLFYVDAEKQEVYVSLRSSEASQGADVNKIASKYGGGGHKHAAGCKFTFDNVREAIPNFFFHQHAV